MKKPNSHYLKFNVLRIYLFIYLFIAFFSFWLQGEKKKQIKSENLNNSQTPGPGKCGNQGKPRSHCLVRGVPISVKSPVSPRCLPHTFL